MESFANLFRKSKLNSLDSNLKQVLTAPKIYRKEGNWGLKHWMPGNIKSRAINFYDKYGLDKDNWVSWKSADNIVLRREAFIENFIPFLVSQQLGSHRAGPKTMSALFHRGEKPSAPSTEKYPTTHEMSDMLSKKSIIGMDGDTFTKYIDCLKYRIKNKHADFVLTGHEPAIHPPFYFYHSDGSATQNSSANATTDLAQRNIDMKAAVIQVTGRILGRHSFRDTRSDRLISGYTVGIAGFVAFLPEEKFAYTPGMTGGGQGRRGPLKQFYVDYISFDDHGRPQIELSAHKQDARSKSNSLFNQRSASSGFSIFDEAAKKLRSNASASDGKTTRFKPRAVSQMPLNRQGLFDSRKRVESESPSKDSDAKSANSVYKSFFAQKKAKEAAAKATNDDNTKKDN